MKRIITMIIIIIAFFIFNFAIFLYYLLVPEKNACIIISLLKGELTVKFERFNLAF